MDSLSSGIALGHIPHGCSALLNVCLLRVQSSIVSVKREYVKAIEAADDSESLGCQVRGVKRWWILTVKLGGCWVLKKFEGERTAASVRERRND